MLLIKGVDDMQWTTTKTFKAVGLSVAGAVATGTAVCGATAGVASSAPVPTSQGVVRHAAGTAADLSSGKITLRVGPAAAVAGSATQVENRLPIGEIIKRILQVLGKGATWLKDQVRRGYSWFVNNVWNKIPSAIRWVISTGYTVYEIFKEIYNYFF